MECLTSNLHNLQSCPGGATSATCNLIFFLLQTVVQKQCDISTRNLYPECYASKIKDGDKFDFVVIGSGSAGSVVASRISENPEWNVLLVEAGDYPNLNSDIPALSKNLMDSDADWGYIPEKTPGVGELLENGVGKWPGGKMVGGTSGMGSMAHIQGNKKDYDTWGALGNQGWYYRDVEKYFKKIEKAYNFTNPPPSMEYQSADQEVDLLNNTIVEAAEKLGYRYYTQETPNGYFTAHQSIKDGVRQSASKVYIADIAKRKNMFLTTNTRVTKLIFNKNSCAFAELLVNGKLLKVYANKEIILSSGAIVSPQILLNSGIGPKEHLQQLGIPLVKNLPVGENLQSHVCAVPIFVKLKDTIWKKPKQDDTDDIYNYFTKKTGALATTDNTNLIAMINTIDKTLKYPNIQIMHYKAYKNSASVRSILSSFSFGEKVITAVEKANRNHSILIPVIILQNPKSRGKVLLKSNNPFDKPLIITNPLKNSEDLDTLQEGVGYFIDLLKTKPLADHHEGLVDIDFGICNAFKKETKEWWRCFVKATTSTMHDPVGTCKMGPKNVPGSVVDAELRVHGIENLRIIDSSIMPNIVSASTNAATMMIAEKATDMIKTKYDCP